MTGVCAWLGLCAFLFYVRFFVFVVHVHSETRGLDDTHNYDVAIISRLLRIIVFFFR